MGEAEGESIFGMGLQGIKDAALGGFPCSSSRCSCRELQDLATAGLAELEKTGKDQLPEVAHAVLSELIAGLNRTAKASDADVAVKLTGPDAAGTFTGIAALSFADATKLETEIKALVKAVAPKEIKEAHSPGTLAKSAYGQSARDENRPTCSRAEAKKVFRSARRCSVSRVRPGRGFSQRIGPECPGEGNCGRHSRKPIKSLQQAPTVLIAHGLAIQAEFRSSSKQT